jgi:indolepyruvate ferredoxin oxidoreductase beta subunit
MQDKITNVRFAGLGGQGIIRASDILAEVAFRAGCDVKKSELHGMSQRGGSVSSDVRFGAKVWSPMIPKGQTDYLVISSADQVDNNLPDLKNGGSLFTPALVPENDLPGKKTLNLALLGALSQQLPFSEEIWLGVIQESFSEKFFEANEKAFKLGRTLKKAL